MRILLSSCLILFLVLSAPVTSAAHDASAKSPELLRLYELISHRLSFMEDVAAWKWANDKPIEDLEREKVILDKATEHADLMGLDGDTVRTFLQAQMNAAKFVQQQAIDKWQAGTPPQGKPKDLAGVLRPAIGRAGDRILVQIGLVLPHLADINPKDLQPYIDLPDDHIAALTEGLQQIRNRPPAQPPIRQIRSLAHMPGMHRITAQKVLRVGTTGDYAPFSSGTEGNYTGIDIDLARALAASLGVELVFVQTSWPTLLEDLKTGKYDIAMSGISRQPFRMQVGYMSAPYHTGGKTPIARCDEVEKLDTLAEINQPGVRAIVNPGGTNERFARNNIATENLRVFDSNVDIFAEIEAKRADVMITDAIEVAYQSARHPTLCPTMPNQTLTWSQKGFLMPKDDAWLHYVNGWLAQIIGDGTLQSIFNRHILGQP